MAASLRVLQWEVAMLAEIFLLRLELLLRQVAAEKRMTSGQRFVPYALSRAA
jgi:hypothetical protein